MPLTPTLAPPQETIYDSYEDMGNAPVPVEAPPPDNGGATWEGEAPPPQAAPSPGLGSGGPPVPAPAATPADAPVQQSEMQAAPSGGATWEGEPPPSMQAPAPEVTEIPTLEEAGATLKDTVSNEALTEATRGGGPGAVKDALGEVAGAVGTAMTSMGGDILPWRRHHTDAVVRGVVESGIEEPTNQNPIQEAWTPLENHMYDDPEKTERLLTEGYTDPATGNHYTGEAAVWEEFQSDKSTVERALNDLRYDPTTITAFLPLLKVAKAPPAVIKGASLIDDAVSLGIGPAIEGVLGAGKAVLKRTGILAPTATAGKKVATEAASGAADALLGSRRAAGAVADTVVSEPSPGIVTLENPNGLFPAVTVKTDGRQVLGVLDDPANHLQVRPLAQTDYENLANLAGRVNPEDKLKLVNAGFKSLKDPDATVARPYLQALHVALPSTPTGTLRGIVPVPTSGADLFALRAQLNTAVGAKNAPVASALVRAAHGSGLLPAGTPMNIKDTYNAIGVIEATRTGPPPISPAVLTAVQGTLRKNLDAIGLTDIAIAIDRVVTDFVSGRPLPMVEGQYLNKVISLGTDVANTADPGELALKLGSVLDHEAIHALRHLNLYKKNEWDVLTEMTKRSKASGDADVFLTEVTKRYEEAYAKGMIPTLPGPDAMVEEAVAEMYRAFVNGTFVPTPVQRTLLEKIAQFFKTLVGVMPVEQRAGKVLEQTASGRIGSRSRGPLTTMTTAKPAINPKTLRPNESGLPFISGDPTRAVPHMGDSMLDSKAWDEIPYVDAAGRAIRGTGWASGRAAPEAMQAGLNKMQQTIFGTIDPKTGKLKYEQLMKDMQLTDEQLLDRKLGKIIDFKLRPANKAQLLSVEQIDRAASLPIRDRFWYETSAIAMAKVLDLPDGLMNKFINALATTSGGAMPEPNTGRTLSIISNRIRGSDAMVPTRDLQATREALAIDQIATDKFGNFSLTFKFLMGLSKNPPKAVIDLQMAHIFGLPDNAILTPRQDIYDFLADYTEGVRDILNRDLQPGDLPWETWQVQAALWIDFRKADGLQGADEFDDYARWLTEARDKLATAGPNGSSLLDNGKIGETAWLSPTMDDLFGETTSFWRDVGQLTLESRTEMNQVGRVSSANYNRLLELDPQFLPPKARENLQDEYFKIQKKAFNKGGFQKAMRAALGRAMNISQLQDEAAGSYKGQVSANVRVPLGATTDRIILDESQQTQAVALISAAYDQEVGAATKFTTVPMGQHDTFSLVIGDPSKKITPQQRLALAAFGAELGVETSAKHDFLGLVVDLHPGAATLDPSVVANAANKHLDEFWPAAARDIVPRRRSGILLDGQNSYREPIAQMLDASLETPIKSLNAFIAKQEGMKRGPSNPEALLRSRQLRDQLLGASQTIRTREFSPGVIDTVVKGVDDAIQGYKRSGGGATLGSSTIRRFGDLAGGWRSLRESAARRDAALAKWSNDATSLVDEHDARVSFKPGPFAKNEPSRLDRFHAETIAAHRARATIAERRNKVGPGNPLYTPLGASNSVVKFKTYHGSGKTDLTILTTNPPARQFDYASSRLGVFMGVDPEVAYDWLPARTSQGIGGLTQWKRGKGMIAEGWHPKEAAKMSNAGRIYETDLHLENAYDMPATEMERFYDNAEDFDFDTGKSLGPSRVQREAQDFKTKLQAEGYDGIVVWNTRPLADSGGKINPKDKSAILEVISFKDVPVYSLAKPLVRPGAPTVPGIYKRGSSEEYLGIRLSEQDRTDLDVEFSHAGRTEKVWQTAVREQDSLEKLRNLARKQRSGAPLTPKEQSQLGQGVKRLEDQFSELKGVTPDKIAGWSDEFVDSVAGRRVNRFVEQAVGIRDVRGATIDPGYYKGVAGRALRAYDNFTSFRRTMSLYSTPRGPAYVLMQAIGNGITLAIANPGALRYYSPIEAVQISRRGGTGFVSHAEEARRRVGLGKTESLGGSRDQLAMGGQPNETFFEKSTSPIVKGIGKIVANPASKRVADAFDIEIRGAAYRSVFEPGYAAIRNNLKTKGGRELQAAAARSGVPSPITGADLATAVRGLGPYFTGEQLRTAILSTVGTGASGGASVVRSAADRIVRDYINDVRTLDKVGIANVNRVGFDFVETRADAVLSRLFMFHYWLSRASVLYLTEAARNPYQLQAWSRAMNSGNRKEEAGWPQWQKDMHIFMQTPAGITGLWNPAYLVGTYLFFQDTTEPLPFEDLTMLGQGIEGTFLNNVMLNPLLQGAIYVLGAGGSDFNPPDFLGTGKWTSDINVWLEKANRDVSTFYATEKGNPKVVPNIDGKALLSWVGNQVTQRGWENDFFGMAPISGFDPNRGEQADLAYFIQDQVLTQNPELNDGTTASSEQLASMVEEALANPDSPLYQAAYENLVALQTAGPGSGQGSAYLDIAGYYGRMVLPFGVTTQATSRRERTIRSNRDEKTPLDQQMGYIDDATPEKQQFDLGYDAVRGAWSPAATAIRDTYSGIKSGATPTGSVVIDGRTWTDADLATLPQADRETLAQYWMHTRHPDLGDQSGWEIQNAAYDAEEAALEGQPMVADYRAFDDYVAQYADGPLAAIQDTAEVNSNYRRFLETLPSGLTEAEYVDEATSVSAFAAITGTKFSRYDAEPMATGRGHIAGLAEGETLGEWKSTNKEAGDAEFESSDEQLTREMENYTKATEILNGYDEMYGNPPGTLAARYASNLTGYTYNGSQVDQDITEMLREGGMSDADIAPPNDKEQGYNKISWYMKWANENGVAPGTQVEEYSEQNSIRYLGEKVADINSGIYSTEEVTNDKPPTTPESLVSDSAIYTPPEKQQAWWGGVGNAVGGILTAVTSVFTGGDGAKLNADPSAEAVAVPAGAEFTPYVGGIAEGKEIASLADQYAGVPYVHEFPTAVDDPWETGWDCSSFVKWLADMNGISDNQFPNRPGYMDGGVPTGAHFQYQWAEVNGRYIDQSQAQPGDVIFFNTDPNKENCNPENWNGCMNNLASHVGVYLGNDTSGRPRMIHAAAPGVGTVYDYLDTYPYEVLTYARIV